jgi:hypothetical protein
MASVPMDGRMHVKVSYQEVEKTFWFRKHLVTGKVLDLVVQHFNIPSNRQEFLRFYKHSGEDSEEDSLLDNSKPLASQIDDGIAIILHPTEPKIVQ